MQNPFQHINDVLNYSGREAYRMLGNQVNTEHLMLGILYCNNKQVNDILEHLASTPTYSAPRFTIRRNRR